jgi:hypothetical protein
MAVDVRVNNVATNVGVVDRSVLLSPEVLEMVVAAVKARLDDEARIARERARDTRVDHRDR